MLVYLPVVGFAGFAPIREVRAGVPGSGLPGIAVPNGRSCIVGCATGCWCMVTISATAGDFPEQR